MPTQDNRSMRITTPLPENELLLTGFSGIEGLSILYSFELSLMSERNDIAFDQLIGESMTVSLGEDQGNARIFNGIVSRFSQDTGARESEAGHIMACYSATIVPWFWLLTRTTDSRIFQEMSVPEIIEQIFTEKEFNDYRMDLGDYDPKEYCVQYAETDFNFISRLLEQEGIYYFFEHSEEGHVLVMADAPDIHSPYPLDEGLIEFRASGAGENVEGAAITDLDKMQEIRCGKYTVNDYYFETPDSSLIVETESQTSLGPGERELYDYPAEFRTVAEGEILANKRLQAEEAKMTTFRGTSNCIKFINGCKFQLDHHYRPEMNDEWYVVTSIHHAANEPVGTSGGGESGGGFSYDNGFTCIPFDVPYRPPLFTPKPKITGIQTAVVVGPMEEDIYTDEHGRVKVQFNWDREGMWDENSSCWIRVSQSWAGTGWGAMFIPRLNQEVIVSFIESDPDRPIITGRVYNGVNPPPYALPGNQTVSTVKSMSSPFSEGFNEIRFEDKDGEEKLFVHAEKRMDVHVKANRHETVGGDRHLTVNGDKFESVEGKSSVYADLDSHEETGASRTLMVMTDDKTKIGGKKSTIVEGDVSDDFKVGHALKVGGDSYYKAENIVIEAGTNVTIKVGKSFVAIESGGIKIGTTGDIELEANGAVKINGKIELKMEGGSSAELKSPATTVKGTGSVTVEGGTVNIN